MSTCCYNLAILPAPRTLACLAAIVLAFSAPAFGGEAEPAAMARSRISKCANAPLIFAGTVTSISRDENAMLITFHVSDPVRGAFSGEEVALREWTGLWTDDPTRFVVGERGYYFLRASGDNGFASLMDRFPIAEGRILLAPAPVNLSSRARRLRESRLTSSMQPEDFATLLRQMLAEHK